MNRKVSSGDNELLARITTDATIFGGKPIIRGHRLAVEHVLGMLAAGDTPETILKGRMSGPAWSMLAVWSGTSASTPPGPSADV